MKTAAPRSIALVFALVTVALCATWFFLASAAPDGLERVAARLGFAARERTVLRGPLAGYEVPWLASPVLRKIAAALLGASLCFLAALGWGRYSARRKT
jgi:hypothetical protein